MGDAKSNSDEAKTVRITWVRSKIGFPQRQRDTLRTLGLNRLHQTVERPDSPELRGQINKVRHLLKIDE